jgi:diacylglycerol kinase
LSAMPAPQEPDEATDGHTGSERPPEEPRPLRSDWPGPLRKTRVVLLGLWRAGHDVPVAYKMVASVVVLVLAAITTEWLDLAIVAAATGLLLMSELFNTAIEKLCDFVEPGHDPQIGAVKDVAAAAAGTAMVFWLIVIVLEGVRLVQTVW